MKFMPVGSILCALLFCSLAQADIQVPFETEWMPTMEELERMDAENQRAVLGAIREFYLSIDKKQPPIYGMEFPIYRPFLMHLFGSEMAQAQTVGDQCVIGGFLTKVVRRSNGVITCPMPTNADYPGFSEINVKCKPGTMVCVPGPFGFEEQCQKIDRNLTITCNSSVTEEDAVKQWKAKLKQIDDEQDEAKKRKLESQLALTKLALGNLNTHCAEKSVASQTYNKGECGILRKRVKAVLDIVHQKVPVVTPVITCPVSGSGKWKSVKISRSPGKVEMEVTSSSETVKASIGTSDPNAKFQMIPGENGKPTLKVSSEDGYKTCSVTEQPSQTASQRPTDINPCKTGAGKDDKENWEKVCEFQDDRAVCAIDPSKAGDLKKKMSSTESRGFGAQGFFEGQPEVKGLIKKNIVTMERFGTDPDKVNAAIRNMIASDFQTFSSNSRVNDLSGAVEKLIASCKSQDKKNKDSLEIIKLVKAKTTIFTCQKFDKDLAKGKKPAEEYLKFGRGEAITFQNDPAGVYETGRINAQGDAENTKIFKLGLRNPIGSRTMANDQPKSEKGHKMVKYDVSDVDLCSDTLKSKKAGEKSASFNRIFKSGEKFRICEGTSATSLDDAKGIVVGTALGDDGSPRGLRLFRKNVDSDETEEFSVKKAEKSDVCELSYHGLKLSTSLKVSGAGSATATESSGLPVD